MIVLVAVIVGMAMPVAVVVAMAVAVIMAVVMGRQGFAGRHHPIRLKQADAQQQRQGHLAMAGAQDAGVGFDFLEVALEGREPLLADQIALIEQQDVAVHHLGPGHLALVNRVAEVFGIDQGDDRIEPGGIAQVAAQEGHGHRQGVSQAGGFHHQVVHRLGPFQDPIHRFEQLAVDRAADAAIAQLHHVFAGGDDQVVIDADFAKLIYQNGGFEPLLVAEDVVQQGGFTGPKKAGDDRDRQAGLAQGRPRGVRFSDGATGAGTGCRSRLCRCPRSRAGHTYLKKAISPLWHYLRGGAAGHPYPLGLNRQGGFAWAGMGSGWGSGWGAPAAGTLARPWLA